LSQASFFSSAMHVPSEPSTARRCATPFTCKRSSIPRHSTRTSTHLPAAWSCQTQALHSRWERPRPRRWR